MSINTKNTINIPSLNSASNFFLLLARNFVALEDVIKNVSKQARNP